jgi:hypothetical protein
LKPLFVVDMASWKVTVARIFDTPNEQFTVTVEDHQGDYRNVEQFDTYEAASQAAHDIIIHRGREA